MIILIITIICIIFIYLTIGTVLIKTLFNCGLLRPIDNDLFGLMVFFFPIVVVWVLAFTFGKWIAKTIYDKIRLYKYNKSYNKNIKLKTKQVI